MKIRFFELAAKLAKQSDHKFQHGAVIVRGSRIYGIGFNKAHKTHPKANTLFKTIHAECAALLDAKCDVKGATLYVYRETKDQCPANSKPCIACSALLKQAGIKRVFYSVETFPFWECWNV